MQKSKQLELSNNIDTLLANSRVILQICNQNLDTLENISKVSEIFADNEECIQVINSIKQDDIDIYNSIMLEKAKVIAEILDINKHVVECINRKKNKIAEQLKDVSQKKNLLIYK